jgi:hypothetical protein
VDGNFYYKILMDGKEFKSKCLKETDDGHWNQTFGSNLMLDLVRGKGPIKIKFYSKGTFSDDLLGTVEIPMASLVEKNVAHDFDVKTKNGAVAGAAHIWVSFVGLKTQSFEAYQRERLAIDLQVQDSPDASLHAPPRKNIFF